MAYRLVRSIPSPARALHVDARGLLFAAVDSSVHTYDTTGKLLRKFSAAKPVLAIAIAPDGRIFTGEEGQIEIFDGAGKLLRTWTDGDRLASVTAIGFTRDGIIAADTGHRCLRHYGRDLSYRNDIGNDNRTRGFLVPNGRLDFDIDGQGTIHACNPGKHRVERYSPGGELLGHIGRFDGLDPEGFGGCCNPTNVALARDGRVFVTEKAEPRAKALTPEGKLAAVVSTEFDAAAKNMDIAVDAGGRVYVADTVGQRIAIFEEVRQ